MFTRCPGCHTVHPVNAALLATGAGSYRCGKCNKLNNALESLFDEWPAPGAQPPRAGDPPVLGGSIDLKAAAKARQDPLQSPGDPDQATTDPARAGATRWMLRTAWIAGAIAILLIALVQWARFQGEPLLERASIRSSLVRAGLLSPPPLAAGEVVLRQRFVPADYLAPDAPAIGELAPQAYLPLVLELEDPGVRAVGFELEFR